MHGKDEGTRFFFNPVERYQKDLAPIVIVVSIALMYAVSLRQLVATFGACVRPCKQILGSRPKPLGVFRYLAVLLVDCPEDRSFEPIVGCIDGFGDREVQRSGVGGQLAHLGIDTEFKAGAMAILAVNHLPLVERDRFSQPMSLDNGFQSVVYLVRHGRNHVGEGVHFIFRVHSGFIEYILRHGVLSRRGGY